MGSYGTILKTTGVVGASRIFTILANLVKTKVIASILGPAGIGIYGLYQSVAEMVVGFGDLGVSQSGVRQVALANSQKDLQRVAVVCGVMRKTVLFSAFVCSILLCLFSRAISRHLFDTDAYRWGVCVVGIYVFCAILSKTQLAVLNGVRRIKHMAVSQICGAVAGGVAACVAVWILHEQGIAFAFAGLGLAVLGSSWLFLRRLHIPKVRLSWRDWSREWKGLIGLGVGLVVAHVASYVTNYYSRVFIRHSLGLESVGIYQSCWAVSNLYVGLILAAMGVDFLPRIMRHVDDKRVLSKSLNEQMELGLVVCLPCVVATFVFAPFILRILYSAEFMSAAFIIRWQIVGVALRLLAWPFGYLLIALGRTKFYVAVQLVFYALELVLLVVFVRLGGINGLGPQFFLAYLIYLGGVCLVGRMLVDFKMSPLLKRVCAVSAMLLALAVGGLHWLGSSSVFYCLGGSVLLLASIGYSWHVARHSFGLDLAALLTRRKPNRA